MVRDPDGVVRAWGSVHDRSVGRMLFVHIVERSLPADVARALLRRPVRVGGGPGPGGRRRARPRDAADRHRRLPDDERQHGWLAANGFERVRTWWQMTPAGDAGRGRPGRVARALGEGRRGVPAGAAHRVRDARRGRPARGPRRARERVRRPLQLQRGDLRGVPAPAARGPRPPLGPLVARGAHRRRRARGGRGAGRHRLRGWGRAAGRLLRRPTSACSRPPAAAAWPRACSARSSRTPPPAAGTASASRSTPTRPTGAAGLYTSMGWTTKYVTESWHRDVPVAPAD